MSQPSPPSPKPQNRKLSMRRKLLFAMVPLTVLALVGEWLARSYRSGTGYAPTGSHSYRDNRIDLMRRAFPNVYDPLLGYRPSPDYSSKDNVWHTQVTIDEDGLRFNGLRAVLVNKAGGDGQSLIKSFAPAERILAVGDSFTFGDQVSDDQTWPSRLQGMLKRPVLNGGVFGYSFAQIVLRAEVLLDEHEVGTVVCSLIPDDLKRCELRRRFTPIPWFEIVDEKLQLRGVPVKDSAKDNELDQQYLRKLMGYSAMLDIVFWNTCKSWWVGQERIVRVHPPGTGLRLGKKLLERLHKKCEAKGVELILILQGQRPEPRADEPVHAPELLAHGDKLGIKTLDLATRFRMMADKDPSLDKKYFRGHMTPAGNRWVAEQLAEVMGRPK